MIRSELVIALTNEWATLSDSLMEEIVKDLLEQFTEALARNERIEIRGFGTFSVHRREPRLGRNPRTGESVVLASRYVPHFKPGKKLRERVNRGARVCAE